MVKTMRKKRAMRAKARAKRAPKRPPSAMARRGRPPKAAPVAALENGAAALPLQDEKRRGRKRKRETLEQPPPMQPQTAPAAPLKGTSTTVKKPWGARLAPPPVPLEVPAKQLKRRTGASSGSSAPQEPHSPATETVGTWKIPSQDNAGKLSPGRLPKMGNSILK